jgi:hypothetical protein
LAAPFQLSCRFIEKHLSYRTNANAEADSRIWRAAAKLISDGQHPSSMGFQRLCVAANLWTHRNLTVVTDNVAMLSVLPAEALQGVQLRCFGVPIRRQIFSTGRR